MTELTVVGKFDTSETGESGKQRKNSQLVQAVKILKKIYGLFSEKKPSWDIPEISEKLKLPGGTTAKYCKVLLILGLIQSERTLVKSGVKGEIHHNTFTLAEPPPVEEIEEVTKETPVEILPEQ